MYVVLYTNYQIIQRVYEINELCLNIKLNTGKSFYEDLPFFKKSRVLTSV